MEKTIKQFAKDLAREMIASDRCTTCDADYVRLARECGVDANNPAVLREFHTLWFRYMGWA